MLISGVDDAGRGPIIGPMILAGVLATKSQEKLIKRAGAKDSKLISHKERIRIAKIIIKNSKAHKVIKVFPEEIDDSLVSGTNLNTLEANKTAEIINFLNSGKNSKEKIKVVVDCPSVNIFAWQNTLEKKIENKSNLKILCEHKADYNYPIVSAASILAKVAREEEVEKIKEDYGEIGSGYPSDPITQGFLKKHGIKYQNSGIFRKSWQTWKNLFPEKDKKQKKLFDF